MVSKFPCTKQCLEEKKIAQFLIVPNITSLVHAHVYSNQFFHMEGFLNRKLNTTFYNYSPSMHGILRFI